MTTHAIDEVFEVVNFVKDNMATKSEVVELSNDFNEFRVETRGEFRELRREFSDINKHLDRLDTAVADVRHSSQDRQS